MLALLLLAGTALLFRLFDPPDQSRTARPALWEAEFSGGGRAYLFGAVHLLPPGIDWADGPVNAAIVRSDALLLEIAAPPGTDNGEAFARLAMRPGRLPIERRLPPDLIDDWRRVMASANVAPGDLAHMDSWAAALAVARAANAEVGLSADAGVDAVLRRRFAEAGKPIMGLETAQGQLALFDALAPADQQAMLERSIDDFDRAAADYRAMLDDWAAGDGDGLLDRAARGILARPAVRQALLDGRNRAWAAELSDRLRSRRTIFVAVGAAHLAGPVGLPALLAARGATVRRLQ